MQYSAVVLLNCNKFYLTGVQVLIELVLCTFLRCRPTFQSFHQPEILIEHHSHALGPF